MSKISTIVSFLFLVLCIHLDENIVESRRYSKSPLYAIYSVVMPSMLNASRYHKFLILSEYYRTLSYLNNY